MTFKDDVLQKAILNVADQLNIGSLELLKILNTEYINHIVEGSNEAKSALILINIYKKLYSLTDGDVRSMQIFIHSNNKLIDAIPFEVLQKNDGLSKISGLLERF